MVLAHLLQSVLAESFRKASTRDGWHLENYGKLIHEIRAMACLIIFVLWHHDKRCIVLHILLRIVTGKQCLTPRLRNLPQTEPFRKASAASTLRVKISYIILQAKSKLQIVLYRTWTCWNTLRLQLSDCALLANQVQYDWDTSINHGQWLGLSKLSTGGPFSQGYGEVCATSI